MINLRVIGRMVGSMVMASSWVKTGDVYMVSGLMMNYNIFDCN